MAYKIPVPSGGWQVDNTQYENETVRLLAKTHNNALAKNHTPVTRMTNGHEYIGQNTFTFTNQFFVENALGSIAIQPLMIDWVNNQLPLDVRKAVGATQPTELERFVKNNGYEFSQLDTSESTSFIYDELRHAKPATIALHQTEQAKYVPPSRGDIFAKRHNCHYMNAGGWAQISPPGQTGRSTHRLTLNAAVNDELLDKLVEFSKHNNVKFKYDANPATMDSVIVYFKNAPSPEQQSEIAEIARPFVRHTPHTNKMIGDKVSDGVFLGIAQGTGKELHEYARTKNIPASIVSHGLGIDEKDVLSEGNFFTKKVMLESFTNYVESNRIDLNKVLAGQAFIPKPERTQNAPTDIPTISGREQTILANYKAGGMAKSAEGWLSAALTSGPIHDIVRDDRNYQHLLEKAKTSPDTALVGHLGNALYANLRYRTDLNSYPIDNDFDVKAARATNNISVTVDGDFLNRNPKKSANTAPVERISVNARCSSALIDQLDKFIESNTDFSYKVTRSSDAVHRADSVTIYARKSISEFEAAQLSDICQPHIRHDIETNKLIGKKLSDGIFLDKNPTSEQCLALIENAQALSPMFKNIGPGKKFSRTTIPEDGLLSAAQFHVLKLLTDDFQNYMQSGKELNQEHGKTNSPTPISQAIRQKSKQVSIPTVDGREQTILANYKAGGVEQAHAAALGAIAIHDRLNGEQGAFLKGMGVSQVEWNALGKGDAAEKMERQASFVAACQWLGNDAKTMGHSLFVATAKNKDLTFERMERDLDHPEKWTGKSSPQKPTPQQIIQAALADDHTTHTGHTTLNLNGREYGTQGFARATAAMVAAHDEKGVMQNWREHAANWLEKKADTWEKTADTHRQTLGAGISATNAVSELTNYGKLLSGMCEVSRAVAEKIGGTLRNSQVVVNTLPEPLVSKNSVSGQDAYELAPPVALPKTLPSAAMNRRP